LRRRTFIYGTASGLCGGLLLFAQATVAEDLTAGLVVNKMSDIERHAYMAGVIEGLAYSRYRHDNKNPGAEKDTRGMGCIYRWWHQVEGTKTKVYKAFVSFPNSLPGPIVASLARKECGDW
jgi:hypothetical protein